MSLINELRNISNPNDTKEEEKGYNPLFLTAIKKRGYFLMGSDTFDLESMECLRKTGRRFNEWLKENKLKLVASEIKDHYKIYN